MKLNIQINLLDNKFFAIIEDKECHICFEILPEGCIRLTNTYVPFGIRTKGIASELVLFAFDYAAKNKLKVIPRCAFIKRFIIKNPRLLEQLKDKENF